VAPSQKNSYAHLRRPKVYYPRQLPLDQDNDLLLINDRITPAVGQILLLSGRVLSPSGTPVRNATVEIWQADNTGAYLHPSSMGYATRDTNFQGYGRFETASDELPSHTARALQAARVTFISRFTLWAAGSHNAVRFKGTRNATVASSAASSERERESVIIALEPSRDPKSGRCSTL
jgi:hypothetical protein